jgi:long-chain acyl-CoA synthetase
MTTDSSPRDTFPAMLFRQARERGDRPAIRVKRRGIWKTTTWAVLGDEVRSLAAGLSADGLRRGDRLALVAENRPRTVATMAAAQCLGAVVAPLHVDASDEELCALLAAIEPTHVFAQDQEQVDKLLSLLPRVPSIRRIVFDEDRGMRHYAQRQIVAYDALLDGGKSADAAAVQAEVDRGRADEPAAIFCTTDAGGRLRAVVHTHASLGERAAAGVALERLTEADVALAYLPPAWIGQHLFGYAQPLVAGYCVACPESSETVLSDLREIGPTWFIATPRMLRTLASSVTLRMQDSGRLKGALHARCMAAAKRIGERRLAGGALSTGERLAWAASDALILGPLRDVLGLARVRVAWATGDSIDAELLGFFRSIGVNLKRMYGTVEAGFLVAAQADGAVDASSVGEPTPGVELRFTAQRELLVRSPGTFLEYRGDPDATGRSRDDGGWLRTGDAGWLGDDGRLRILGRLSELETFANGATFAPSRVEAALKASPLVREALAFSTGAGACALVVVDPVTAARWADRSELAYSGYAELAALPEVGQLIAEHVARANAELAKDPMHAASQVRRFAILHREPSVADGEVTRFGELRRSRLLERFRPLADATAAGRPSATIDTEVVHDDGRVTFVPVEIRILDARSAASIPMKKAA